MWLINSSIGRKVVMSVTGIALILFLTFHASMNVVALVSAKGYNMICEFLGANWYAVVATIGLAALVALHFIYAIWLTLQNRRARGNNKYAMTEKPEKVEWASQNMLVLGLIVVLGLCLHLYNFWYNMMFAELAEMETTIAPTNGVGYIAQTFSCPVFTAIYIVWLVALWFHLTHGLWSAVQTLGWNGKTWFKRWRTISCVYTTIVILMFVAVALAFSFGYRPCDFNEECGAAQNCTEMVEKECPMKHGGCPMKKDCLNEKPCPVKEGCCERPDCPCKSGEPGKHCEEPCHRGE